MLGNISEETTNFDFVEIPDIIKLSGTTFENRQLIIPNLLENTPIEFIRDFKNEYDSYAIKVLIEHNLNKIQIGWVPKEFAAILAPEIDAGIKWTGEIFKITGNELTNRGILIKLSHK